MDELAKLNKLPLLINALDESHKYGGCIMIGIQSIAHYSHAAAQSIIDMFNSFFFFRCQNPQTNEIITKILGVVEQEELHEKLSYGSSVMRDGVSFSKQTKSKQLVLPIEIANLPALEALALRSVFESLNYSVRIHFIGNAKQIVDLFAKNNELYEIIIISGHGSNKGMYLPELSEELESTMPYKKLLTADNFLEFLHLSNQIIVNTSCCLGKKDFANSFLTKGANIYIGATDYLEGNEALMLVINFIYSLLEENKLPQESFIKAKSIIKEGDLFDFYSKK